MPKYLTLFSYTPEAWARMIDNPGDRETAVRELAEAMGASLQDFSWMFGEFDGYAVFDAPDSVTTAGIAVAVASTGVVSRLQTHELIGSEDAGAVLDAAGEALGHYVRPGEQDT